ncbi:hypothetical protein C900_01935 [Fulvivirga imtechensis AK7]|uniref:Uncharacterized protein n=1 Tax=Fulvivirga imtechensis AK7 TaxID=1237149 RepID=L8JTA9_9BACT|nr:DUF1302 family protein [Fulvivirga imtechensis]ELR72070.1 hypothetical protein C900_01935 [Fulvivirga imtechensis AK7]
MSISGGFGQAPNEGDSLSIDTTFFEMDTADTPSFESIDLSFDEMGEGFDMPSGGVVYGQKASTSFWDSYIADPMRLEVKYEIAYKVAKPDRIMNNRTSFRVEYSKFLFNKVTLQVDARVFAFLKNDHRTRNTTVWLNDSPSEAEISFAGRARDAYLQTSFNKTSIKVGYQTLSWGESEFATVTDEISPLDYREPLTLNIDELRLCQFMFTVDQYSSFGKWSTFFTPDPRFNQHPKKGTGYYYAPFGEGINYHIEGSDRNLFEYGVRWKKTFGKSDIGVMAARLVNNEYTMRMDTVETITQRALPYFVSGITFNRAINNFLIKGEVAIKSPKAYNNASFQVVKKNALDASLGVDYSLTNTFKLSMEAVNYHVIDWDEDILGVPENNYMLLFVMGKQLMKNDLSISWVTMYNGPYTSFFNLLTTSYNLNDQATVYFDVLVPISDEVKSGFYRYRDQKQVGLRFQYQF